MKCKNPHCTRQNFIPVIEGKYIIGVTCGNCGARYSEWEIEIKEEVNRDGYWNSVFWATSKEKTLDKPDTEDSVCE